jgi:hypothetical protein
MFLENKYSVWYYNIIENAKRRKNLSEIYCEKHHIIPKSMGGDEIVFLTAKEHYIAHLLLPNMTEGMNRRKMLFALHCMSYMKNDHTGQRYVNSRLYEYYKKKISEERSLFMKNNNPMNNSESKSNHRVAMETRGPTRGNTGIKHTSETKRKISLANSGKEKSSEHKEKLKTKAKEQWKKQKKDPNFKARRHSEETKEKLRIKAKEQWDRKRKETIC